MDKQKLAPTREQTRENSMSVPNTEPSKPIIVEPCSPSLEELLAKVTPENRHSEEITDSVGSELL